MLTEGQLAKVIASWKDQLGVDVNDRKCVPIDSGDRQDMYKTLIETLIVIHGYSEDDFDTASLYRMIMEASVNPKSKNKKVWLEAADDDWMRALATKFPKPLVLHDKSKEAPPVERPKREKQESKYKSFEEEPFEITNPIDRSELGEIPTPSFTVDEEFLKSLRGDNDE